MAKSFVWWDLSEIPLFFYHVVFHGTRELLLHGKINLRMEWRPDEKEGLMLINSRTGEEIGCYNEAHECPIDCP